MEIKKNMTSYQLCDKIAEALKADARFENNMVVKQYGPSGLRAASSVYLLGEDEEIIACITVEADGNGWYAYQTHETTSNCEEGSINWLNNLHFVRAPLPRTMEEVVDLAYAHARYNVCLTCDLTLDNGTEYSFQRIGYADIDEAKRCFQTTLTNFLKNRGCAAGTEFTAHVSYEDKDGNYLDSDDGDGIIGATEALFNVPETATGLYLTSDDPSEELEKIIVKPDTANSYYSEVSADWFLHGVCGIFALALHKRFGYAIRYLNGLDEDVDEGEAPEEFLLHVYCVTNDGLFVDVRGITEDEDKLIDPFLDLCDKNNVSGYDYDADECEKTIRNDMSSEEYDTLYNFANSIIDLHPDWYSITDKT